MSETRPERDVLHLAEAVADGSDIEWGHMERGDALDPGRLRSLELIDSVLRDYVKAAGEVRDRLRAPLFPPDSKWGPLRILEPIGTGAFGQVFRAFDRSLARDLALKILRDPPRKGAGVPEFLEEARRLARVRHPGVLTVYGVAVHEGHAGIWTELVRGRNLEEMLATDGPFAPEEAVRIGIALCDALSAVHAAGLIHRDLKTQNVMREESGRVVLTDFGAMDERFDEDRADRAGVGSLLSVAPEILSGERATPGSDVYSLGVLLYRILSGRYPAVAETPRDLLVALDRGGAPLREVRPEVPEALAAVVDRALDRDPAKRFPGPNAMAQALRSAVDPNLPVLVEAKESYRPRSRNSMMPAFAAGLAISIMAAGLGFYGIPWLAERYQSHEVTIPSPNPVPSPKPPEEQRLAAPSPSSVPVGLRSAPVLYRVDELGRERLANRSRIRSGDQLVLEVQTGPQPVTCFVLDEDGSGNNYVLFPLPGYRLQNPLPAAGRHRLPDGRGGKAVPARMWSVDSENGREDVLVITSLEPLPWLESALRELPRASPPGSEEPSPLASTSVGHVTRGIGRVTPAPTPGRLSSILDRLRESKEFQSGRAGFWRIRLQAEPQIAY